MTITEQDRRWTSTKSTRPAYTLVEVIVAMAIVAMLVALVIPAVVKVRASAARLQCQNNMRQIGLALHNYHDARKHFPSGFSLRVDGGRYMYLGWPARVLPFLELDPLWRSILSAFATDPDPAVFYGHAAHLPILGTPISPLTCPTDPRLPGPLTKSGLNLTFTSYLGVAGSDSKGIDGVLFRDSAVRLIGIVDGTSQTLMLGERPPPPDLAFGWWYRGWGQAKDGSAEMVLDVRAVNVLGARYPCPSGPYEFRPGAFDDQCAMFHFWSPHAGGANFAFADGSVKFIRYEAAPLLPALASRAGGEVAVVPD